MSVFLGLGKVTLGKKAFEDIKSGKSRDFLGYKDHGALVVSEDEAAGTVTVIVMNETAFSTVFVPSYTVALGDKVDTWTVSLF